MRIAFKEWAAICRGLGRGEQIVILRKGGIVEPGGAFRLEHPEFLLFPTCLHQTPESLIAEARHLFDEAQAELPSAGEIVFRHCARVTDHFRIQSADLLPQLRAFHIWSDAIVAERFHRWQKSLDVLLVRVSALSKPARVPQRDEYAGCKSWVELADNVDVAEAEPVLPEDIYMSRAGAIHLSLRA